MLQQEYSVVHDAHRAFSQSGLTAKAIKRVDFSWELTCIIQLLIGSC
ncbi:hypothetical protein [Nostoc sp. 'Lobaria pulmonaria (5183) cyanobiont']|nr:hypothetical protein [Nostoc sp. 'Lobaria pulmonaria (5183) cyanobiont']